jgi:Lon protease-like protein
MTADRIEVALFPIPTMVAFPGTVVPLHVFEPRYRRLVHESVEDNRPVAVCHTRKTIRAARKDQSLEQALSSNQATYQPHEIFSAGRCEIRETTEDGRLLAHVFMEERVLLREELQALPYRIVACERLEDGAETLAADAVDELKTAISTQLEKLMSSAKAETQRPFVAADLMALDAATFSYRVFQFLRFDADLMQEVLEARSAGARLELIWGVLRHC